jgi:phosphopantetheine--protein transferase-like protein
MIVGIGMDIVSVERVSALWNNHSRRASEVVFTPAELERCGAHGLRSQERPTPAQARYLAERFTGKEAVLKVLGVDAAMQYELSDIEILGRGTLSIRLSGFLQRLARERGIQVFKGSCGSTIHHAVGYVLGERT